MRDDQPCLTSVAYQVDGVVLDVHELGAERDRFQQRPDPLLLTSTKAAALALGAVGDDHGTGAVGKYARQVILWHEVEPQLGDVGLLGDGSQLSRDRIAPSSQGPAPRRSCADGARRLSSRCSWIDGKAADFGLQRFPVASDVTAIEHGWFVPSARGCRRPDRSVL